jgi:glucose/arabinose dehydrogenase
MIFRPVRLSIPWLIFVLLGTTALPPRANAAAERFDFKEHDRVLLIGDTFFEREVDYGHIEARLTALFPGLNLTFRNLSWAADTPMGQSRASFDWNKLEKDWIKRVKDQVALVNPTVAFLSYGTTASLEGEAGLPKFRTDLLNLMDAIDEAAGRKVRFALFGPLGFEKIPNLDASVIQTNNARMKIYAEAIKQLAAQRGARFVPLLHAFTGKGPADPQWTENGLHLTEQGYQMISFQVQHGLGHITMWRFESPQFDALRTAIRRKNELFFHRWRPANWTYLFGFRKNEQGQNAVEIPKFDPLIEEWEAKIAKLRNVGRPDTALVKELLETDKPPARDHHDPNFKPQPAPTFDVADGFEVSLWAENPMLYKPIQINWDAQGRLWAASSRVYPQIQPGQEAEDAIIVLEDTDGDGKADKHTVFADGLLIPTGVVPDGNDGCYVAASHELLHFKDTNGDGKADEKRIVLTSFGTEDTHHNLHTLRWGYDGHLYMNQSIYTHSHVETPHGVVRLNSAGIWRFDPASYRLEIFTKGGCNPWGHHWDQYGNSFFTDGAGFKGVYHAMEGATYFTYADMRREAESITPGNWPKFCSLELVHSPNFPSDWQGDAITCDFRAHRIVRFKLEENGSTFAGKEMPDLLRTTNVTFRPIDVRLGPDGALYIADWSNPIIQHGEVDFRDPRRDHEHGRIWRVIAKSGIRNPKSETPKKQNLTKLSNAELLELTLSKNGWEQEQARVVLRQRGAVETLPELNAWLSKQSDPRAKLEAMWLYEAWGRSDSLLTGELAAAKDGHLRAAASRGLTHQD